MGILDVGDGEFLMLPSTLPEMVRRLARYPAVIPRGAGVPPALAESAWTFYSQKKPLPIGI